MILTFNPNIAIKYVLDIHSALPSYPTRQDFIFDVLSYMVKVTISKSKIFDKTDLKFSSKTLKYIFGDKLTPEFLEQIKPLMKSLVEEGIFTKTGEFIFINESEFFNYYEISN